MDIVRINFFNSKILNFNYFNFEKLILTMSKKLTLTVSTHFCSLSTASSSWQLQDGQVSAVAALSHDKKASMAGTGEPNLMSLGQLEFFDVVKTQM